MKNISLVFVAALSLAVVGCKKKGGDCEKAIDHSMELSKADMQKTPGMDMQKMRDIAVQHCKADKWPDEALKCMTDAKTETDAQACYGKLTHEQQESMNKAAAEAMKGAAPPAGSDMGSAGAGGAPPAGSDTGSAGAGSAPAGAGSAPAGSADTGGSAGSAAPAK